MPAEERIPSRPVSHLAGARVGVRVGVRVRVRVRVRVSGGLDHQVGGWRHSEPHAHAEARDRASVQPE